MLEDLDALATKLTELGGRVRLLRDENQQLRTDLAAAQGRLDNMQARVDQAMQRIDTLLERLPDDAEATR
jgi:hypothetical protein